MKISSSQCIQTTSSNLFLLSVLSLFLFSSNFVGRRIHLSLDDSRDLRASLLRLLSSNHLPIRSSKRQIEFFPVFSSRLLLLLLFLIYLAFTCFAFSRRKRSQASSSKNSGSGYRPVPNDRPHDFDFNRHIETFACFPTQEGALIGVWLIR